LSKRAILVTAFLLSSSSLSPVAHAQDIHLGSSGLTFVSQGKKLRYGFNVDGKPVVSPDAKAGIFIGQTHHTHRHTTLRGIPMHS